MPLPLEDYALVGDAHGAALVGRDGSVDWLCLPRFDSPAVFAALLDAPGAGRWLLAPEGSTMANRWRYRGDSLVLETEWETVQGSVRVVDFMPEKDESSDLVRVVEGLSGSVSMVTEIIVRFDYGSVVPWVQRTPADRHVFIAGPDALYLDTPVVLHGADLSTRGQFTIRQGERVAFVLTHQPSHLPPPARVDADSALASTEAWWASWMSQCTYNGPYDDAVRRSLVVLKGLTYQPTGGIVAAPTTSLPEQLGGTRNWDYRYCWLRDATITLLALLEGGFGDEARAWRSWLLRAVAGDPAKLQIMYGVAGERRLDERELPWLQGYQGARPVRVGNAAVGQLQLDVYGEVLDALHQARVHVSDGHHRSDALVAEPGAYEGDDEGPAWALQTALMEFLEGGWDQPDQSMWEMRTEPRHFTSSKVMAWVAVDRSIRTAEQFGLSAPIDRWRVLRATIRTDVLSRGFDETRQSFTQSYGSSRLDASLLTMLLVGFLPPTDPRMVGTVDAIVRELMTDGLLRRYDTGETRDGLTGDEGRFLACTLWLAECQALMGRVSAATETFERVLSLQTDLGLLAEEYDPHSRRLVGNFPQAFSHVPLISAASELGRARRGEGGARRRSVT
ncbi:MAG: glycoside hydrolase family 15 protein [Actinomycetes bacterium]